MTDAAGAAPAGSALAPAALPQRRRPRLGGSGLIGPALAAPVTLWLLATFAVPLAVVVVLSFQEFPDPFAPLSLNPSGAQFATIFGDAFYLRVVGETLGLGALVTLLTVLLGYPLALWLVRLPARWRSLAFAVILIPLLTNVVVRSLGIVLLLAPDGLINQALALVGLPPVRGMLYTHGAVALALAQVFMPFLCWRSTTSSRVHRRGCTRRPKASALPARCASLPWTCPCRCRACGRGWSSSS